MEYALYAEEISESEACMVEWVNGAPILLRHMQPSKFKWLVFGVLLYDLCKNNALGREVVRAKYFIAAALLITEDFNSDQGLKLAQIAL